MIVIKLIVDNTEKQIKADSEANLLDVLRQEGLLIASDCNGNGTCGKCKVNIKEKEKRTFHQVLSCRTKVSDGMVVSISRESFLKDSLDFLVSSPDDLENPVNFDSDLGIAIDLGTTTIAGKLIRTSTGQELSSLIQWNSQIPYGADVISRVQYCMKGKDGQRTLSHLVQEQILQLILSLLQSVFFLGDKQNQDSVSDHPVSSQIDIPVVIAGNTIMQHIFAGFDPSSMAASPYKPLTLFDQEKAVKIPGYPDFLKIRLLPCISGFVGGDITSGILATNLVHKDGNTLFLDIGTNGEMALWQDGRVLTCSVATGPALEGAQIACGTYSKPGAISHVSWDKYKNKLEFQIIQGKKQNQPQSQILQTEKSNKLMNADTSSMTGICGSGLIDLLAVLLDLGIISPEGRILNPEELEDVLDEDLIGALENQLGLDFLMEDVDGNGIFYLNESHSVYLCTQDVRNLQLAKASVRTGVELLLKEANISYQDLSEVVIAGNFGTHLNLESVGKIVMLPKEILKKVTFLGNGSLQGAVKILCEEDAYADVLNVQKLSSYIELAEAETFAEEFIKQLSF